MKKLLLVSAIVFGASSIAAAQTADIDPAASKIATTKAKATVVSPKEQKAIEAQAKLTGARPKPAEKGIQPQSAATKRTLITKKAKSTAPAKQD